LALKLLALKLFALELFALKLLALKLFALELSALKLLALKLLALELFALKLFALELFALELSLETFASIAGLTDVGLGPRGAKRTIGCPGGDAHVSTEAGSKLDRSKLRSLKTVHRIVPPMRSKILEHPKRKASVT
jgi:hypothetical protein